MTNSVAHKDVPVLDVLRTLLSQDEDCATVTKPADCDLGVGP